MEGRLILSDYRCFRREQPAVFQIKKGFTSILGSNNSGKSALIKSIYEIKPILEHLNGILTNEGTPLSALMNNTHWNKPASIFDHEEIVCERQDPKPKIEISILPKNNSTTSEVTSIHLEFSKNGASYTISFESTSTLSGKPTKRTINLASKGMWYLQDSTGVNHYSKRIVEFLQTLIQTQYIGPFRNAINNGTGNHYDIQIGTGFITTWHNWKTGPNKGENKAILRVTDDIRKLVGAQTLEINASVELQTLQIIINGRLQKISEMGSGLSQLIIILANILIKKPSYIIIDEPETNLHPGLHSPFLNTIASYTRYGVIYATHSIGLARLTENCYCILRENDSSIIRSIEKFPKYSEFLGSLGIAGFQELGWNKILLVEGTYDVRTAQELLRIYDKEKSTIVMPLGGDSMINRNATNAMGEILRLAKADNIFALIDSERISENGEPCKNHKDFYQVCLNLKINCLLTKRRAIENYLTTAAIQEAFGEDFKALGEFEISKNSRWGKSESWRAARKMTKDDLKDTDLGDFLESI